MRAPAGFGFVVLLAAACSSESRLVRISPFSTHDKTDPDRLNGWPLIYSERAGTSVLWPLVDVDRRGFALRPLVSKDDSDWDVLFPLSHFDASRGEGWALTGYAFKENRGLFPLCNFGPSFNYFFPFWWQRDHGEVSEWGLFPVAAVGEVNYAGPIWWSPNHDEKSDGQASFGLFPLLTWSGVRQIGPVWWNDRSSDGTAFGVFPLVWSARGGDQLAVLPFYIQDSSPERDLRVLLLPPTWWQKEGDRSRHVCFPFFAHTTNGDADHWFTLFGDRQRDGDESSLNVYPLWWSSRSPSQSQQILAPFYLYRERGNERLLVTPLGGRGWDVSGETRFVNFLGPLYHHSTSAESETTSIVWPLFQRDRTGDATTTRAWPLFDVTSSPSRTSGWVAAGLGRYVGDSESSSLRFWPLYGQSSAAESPDPLFDWSLVSVRSHGDSWSNHLFPLYWGSGDALKSSYTTLLGLARFGSTSEGSAWRLWPLASGSNDEKADGWLDRATLFRRERRGDATSTWLFPLYSGHHSEDDSRDDFLLTALHHERTKDGSAWRLWPLFSTTDADGLDDFVDAITLVGIHPHPDKTHVHVGTSLLFGYDEHGEGKRSWNARTLGFFDVGHQETQLPAKPLKQPRTIERNYAGFLFDRFLVEQRVVATPDGESHDESHYRLPFLHEYERTRDTKEWDLLLWAVHSKHTPKEDDFSFLYYGYRSERHGEQTTRDIFPFITYDTAPDTKRFSFLWRLFRYERQGDQVGGHVFFIPWGDDLAAERKVKKEPRRDEPGSEEVQGARRG